MAVLEKIRVKLGVVISTLIAVFIFHETPRVTQVIGILLAVGSILLIHTDRSGPSEGSSCKWLLVVLLL